MAAAARMRPKPLIAYNLCIGGIGPRPGGLAVLETTGDPPPWAKAMANKRRKTLVVCRDCHDLIHAHRETVTQ